MLRREFRRCGRLSVDWLINCIEHGALAPSHFHPIDTVWRILCVNKLFVMSASNNQTILNDLLDRGGEKRTESVEIFLWIWKAVDEELRWFIVALKWCQLDWDARSIDGDIFDDFRLNVASNGLWSILSQQIREKICIIIFGNVCFGGDWSWFTQTLYAYALFRKSKEKM